MCKRTMEQHAEPAADYRAAASDADSPEQEERAGTSGGAGDDAARTPSTRQQADNNKKKSAGRELPRRPAATGEESARERLKRHRTEMAGRVRVPDMWGQERLLGDWVDCAVFDRPLDATRRLLTARDALVAECAAAPQRHGHGATARPLPGCS